MNTINQWLDEYGESHQHPFNKLVHWICVPAIMFSLFGLLFSIPFFSEKSWYANWGAIVIIPILFFYLRLSKVMFISFILIGFLLLKVNELLYNNLCSSDKKMIFISLLIFIIAWFLQFICHKIEGKKPSFLKDIQFLLIGPAWLLSFIFKKLQISY